MMFEAAQMHLFYSSNLRLRMNLMQLHTGRQEIYARIQAKGSPYHGRVGCLQAKHLQV